MNNFKISDLRRNFYYDIKGSIEPLYIVVTTNILGKLVVKPEFVRVDIKTFQEVSEKIRKVWGDKRFVTFIDDYYKDCRVEPSTDFYWFTYTTNSSIINDQIVKNLNYLFTFGFHLDLSDKKKQNAICLRQELFPKILIPYTHNSVGHLLGTLSSKKIIDDNSSIFGITIGRYVPEFKGDATITINFCAQKKDFSLDQASLAFILRFLINKLITSINKEIKSMFLDTSLRSAVAAIMARNMSHNIGSHVLNYLSNSEELDNLWVI